MLQMKIVLFLAVLVLVKAQSEEQCKKLKKELEKKNTAWRYMCIEEKNPPECCKKIEKVLKEREEILERRCTPCPQFSMLFPKKACNRCVKDYVVSPEQLYSQTKITALTGCAWVKIDSTTEHVPYIISYAVPGSPNEFNLYAYKDEVSVVIRNNVGSATNTGIIDDKWHSLCVTWTTRGGYYSIFVDGAIMKRGTIMSGKQIPRDGTWAIGQHQHSNGRFYPGNSLTGEITNVNIWDEVLTNHKIREYSSSCQSSLEGDVKAWKDFRSGVHGAVQVLDKSSCCAAKS